MNISQSVLQRTKKVVSKAKLVTIALLLTQVAYAFEISEIPYEIPGGWSTAERSSHDTNAGKPYKNVHIYRKGSEQTYVLVADMMDGAHVRFLQEYETRDLNGFILWKHQSMSHWWDKLGTLKTSKVAVVNAAFFDNDTYSDKGTLSFGLKVNGVVVDQGSNNDDLGGKPLRQMNFYEGMPGVTTWYRGSLESSPARNVIVGRHPDSDGKRAIFPMGRTFICAKPFYSEKRKGSYNLFVVYVSDYKTQNSARQELRDWGCNDENLVMLDGHKSSQLITKGGIKVNPGARLVNQAIGIFNGFLFFYFSGDSRRVAF